MTILGPIIAGLSGPVLIAIAAIAAIIAIGVLLIKNWDSIKESNKETFEAIEEIIGTVVGTVKPIIEDMAKFFVKQFKKIADFVNENMPLIRKTIERVMKIIKKVFDTVWPAIAAVVKVAWDTMKVVVGGTITNILDTIKLAMQIFTGDWEGAWNTIKDIGVNTFNSFKDLVSAIFSGLVDNIGVGVNLIIGQINRLIGNFNGVIDLAGNIPILGKVVSGFKIPEIPQLAAGGIVTQPTLALVGESGPEAIIPLSRLQETQEAKAVPTFAQGAFQGATFQINVPDGKAETFMSELSTLTRNANLRNRLTNG